jgi:hypothetical protein
MRRQQPERYEREYGEHSVDLDSLRPVPLAEVAKGPNREWNDKAKAPELFEQWWAKHSDKHWSVKHAAREGWYACAESLGVYDDK